MSPDNVRYCIKPDYQPNLAAAPKIAGDRPPYWTPERIQLSRRYQYDVYRIAAELMRSPGVASVLDVGSGPPAKLAALLPAKPIAVHLVDAAQTAALAAQMLPAAKFTVADLDAVKLDLGQHFDLVIFSDVIEHLRDPDPCLAFIRRHLAPEGLLLVSTPERDILRGRDCRNCPHPDHVREWNGEEFARFLESRCWRILRRGNLPARRTFAPLRLLGAMLDRTGLAPAWYSCQFALCRPA